VRGHREAEVADGTRAVGEHLRYVAELDHGRYPLVGRCVR
jgi:hypothetical protein